MQVQPDVFRFWAFSSEQQWSLSLRSTEHVYQDRSRGRVRQFRSISIWSARHLPPEGLDPKGL